jgi:hypothetical protein
MDICLIDRGFLSDAFGVLDNPDTWSQDADHMA